MILNVSLQWTLYYPASETGDKTYEVLTATGMAGTSYSIYPRGDPSFAAKIHFNKNPVLVLPGKIKAPDHPL